MFQAKNLCTGFDEIWYQLLLLEAVQKLYCINPWNSYKSVAVARTCEVEANTKMK
jgi:hypothetical protein